MAVQNSMANTARFGRRKLNCSSELNYQTFSPSRTPLHRPLALASVISADEVSDENPWTSWLCCENQSPPGTQQTLHKSILEPFNEKSRILLYGFCPLFGIAVNGSHLLQLLYRCVALYYQNSKFKWKNKCSTIPHKLLQSNSSLSRWKLQTWYYRIIQHE